MTRSTAWMRLKREGLIAAFGGCCQACGSKDRLEFAHVVPTPCRGMGRGSTQRVRDVVQHPRAYVLLCVDCHDSLDGRVRRKR
jgi:hypothetical protein